MLKEGLISFELMQKLHKLEPKVEHYEMPIQPNYVILKTLLSACQNYENVYIRKVINQQLIELKSCRASSFVLLSNICASLGMWDNVIRVRTKMKDGHLGKIACCRWIELGETVHKFFVQDRTHS